VRAARRSFVDEKPENERHLAHSTLCLYSLTCVANVNKFSSTTQDLYLPFKMAEMLAIVAPSYCDPSGYELSTTVARPVLTEPSDVIIRVHAASVNPIDVKLASGIFKMALTDEYEIKIDMLVSKSHNVL
jgi:hypothetical protein